MPLVNIIVKEMTLDTKKAADALQISEESAAKEFGDGRVVSRFSEHWAAKLFEFEKAEGTNDRNDGTIKVGQFGEVSVSVKSLTKSGIKFQDSKNQGKGRTCTEEDLIRAIKERDVHLAVDVTAIPKIRLIAVPQEILLKYVDAGELTCTGWDIKQFNKMMADNPAKAKTAKAAKAATKSIKQAII